MADQLSSPPKDTFNAAYLTYLLLGTSYLLPWSTFTTAIDYFGLLYPWGHINRVFTVAYMIFSLISVSLTMFIGLRVSALSRVNTGLVISFVMLALVPIMNSIFIPNNEGTVTTYVITIIAAAMCGIAHGIVYSSMVGSISRDLPTRYMQALAAGSGVSGLLSSFLRIITKAAMPQTDSGTVTSAYIYFLVCVLVIMACLVSYNLVDRLPVIWYYKNLRGSGPVSVYLLKEDAEHEKGDDGLKPASHEFWSLKDLVFYKHVWNRIQGYGLSIALVYVVTVSIIPGHVTEDLKSSYFGDWYPILLVLCSNTFDVVGRSIPGFKTFMIDKKGFVIGGAIGRMVFYPLFYLCLHGPAFFQQEAVAMVVTSLFGFTGGYFTCLLFMLAPKSVPLDEAEAAGFLMVTVMQLGLLCSGFGFCKNNYSVLGILACLCRLHLIIVFLTGFPP